MLRSQKCNVTNHGFALWCLFGVSVNMFQTSLYQWHLCLQWFVANLSSTRPSSFRILDFFEISLIGNLTDKFLAEYNYVLVFVFWYSSFAIFCSRCQTARVYRRSILFDTALLSLLGFISYRYHVGTVTPLCTVAWTSHEGRPPVLRRRINFKQILLYFQSPISL